MNMKAINFILDNKKINETVYNEFKKNLDGQYFRKIDFEIKKIKNKKLILKIQQCIRNYNFYKKIGENSGEYQGMKFLYLCIAIESFYNYDEEKYSDCTKNFVDFFSALSDKSKILIEKNFNLRKKMSNNQLVKKFGRFIYEKRSLFLHQGVFFECCPERSFSYICSFEEDKKIISLRLKLKDFEILFLDALLNKIKIKRSETIIVNQKNARKYYKIRKEFERIK